MPVFEVDQYRLVRCKICQLVFVANPPSADELKHIYSFAAGYHTNFQSNRMVDRVVTGGHFKAARKRVAKLSRLTTPGRLLDVGASAGFFVKAAVDAGWEAKGVELSADAARLASERYGVEVLCGRLEDFALEPGSFDVVTMWDLIEHVVNPKEELEQARTLLRPGGLLVISTPNLDGWYPRLSYKVAPRIGRWPAVEPPLHLSQFTVKSLRWLLADMGWKILSVNHSSQRLRYSFGRLLRHMGVRRLIPYAGVFMPLAAVGPFFKSGDEIEVFASPAS